VRRVRATTDTERDVARAKAQAHARWEDQGCPGPKYKVHEVNRVRLHGPLVPLFTYILARARARVHIHACIHTSYINKYTRARARARAHTHILLQEACAFLRSANNMAMGGKNIIIAGMASQTVESLLYAWH